MTRRYTSEIGIIIGPQQDIPAPDVNTNPQIMAWMMDTYSMNTGTTATGVVTGKPIHLGGSLGRVKATGRGVFVTGREAARRINLDLNGARVAVQGFGNVGSAAAELFAQAGAKIVAIQDHTGTIVNEGGMDMAELMPTLKPYGGVGGFKGAEKASDEAFWDMKCDILIPAALEGQITPERARRTTAKLVLEGANGPTLPEADDILADRGILVVPDVICNAGGVTVSYFEWVQDFSLLLLDRGRDQPATGQDHGGCAQEDLGHRRPPQDHPAHGHLRRGLRAHPDSARGTRPLSLIHQPHLRHPRRDRCTQQQYQPETRERPMHGRGQLRVEADAAGGRRRHAAAVARGTEHRSGEQGRAEGCAKRARQRDQRRRCSEMPLPAEDLHHQLHRRHDQPEPQADRHRKQAQRKATWFGPREQPGHDAGPGQPPARQRARDAAVRHPATGQRTARGQPQA